MKVVFIGQKGIPAIGGGVERYVEDIATRLVTQDHEVIVYTRPYYTSKKITSYKNVSLVSLPSIRTKHLDAISHTFLAVVHACFSKVDIIHFQSIGPALLSWLPKLLRPKMIIVSTLQSRDYEHLKWGSFACAMLKLGERFMCRFSDELIVVTEKMKDYVKSEYNFAATVVPNGSNLYDVIENDDHIKTLGLEKQNYIVAISRLVRHKGLAYLIDAYKQLTTNQKLVIVGSGSFTDDYVSELKELAGDNPNIIFTGNQSGESLAQLYSHATLFVQPSESEGLSLALLEAMSRQVPVLVSDILENTDAVKDAGFIFESKNITDLKEKLQFILDDPEQARVMAIAGRKIIEKHYNWENIVQDIMKLYTHALADKKASFLAKHFSFVKRINDLLPIF
ncbi:glycosyltransferase family 4 protein [Candidatus Falkowbacteria bacterium]|nr:MAG: glycosyltransferase family 4 protein [Candidatus Falkowbacteria bacterium]